MATLGYNGVLKLTGKVAGEYQINSCSIAFRRDTGPDGRPSSSVYGGKISLTAPASSESELMQAAINAGVVSLAGSIQLTEAGGTTGVFRTIEFTNAFMADYQESFDINGGSPFTCAFTISAETITVGSAKIDNNWPKTS